MSAGRSSARFRGKVAIVTGGGSGIGEAAARRLALEGAYVVVADVADDAGEAVASNIGGQFVHLDVGNAAEWAKVVDEVESTRGGIDLAHLNAGIALGAYPVVVEELTDAEYERIMSVNADGVFHGIRAVVPSMKRRGGGAIVVTSSLAGVGPHPDDPIYAATKHFVIGLVRSLGCPFKEHGITVNAVCPGAVDTPLLDATGRRDAIEARRRPLMIGDDIAEAVTMLLAGSETGHVYTVMSGRGAERYEFPGIPGMPST
ncbi:MAG: SDR family oxidoreductase [Actinobacteria bacterium]|nr:SDR family oxidoreductase [Actinomycetota bacterium]